MAKKGRDDSTTYSRALPAGHADDEDIRHGVLALLQHAQTISSGGIETKKMVEFELLQN
jgi:hypothetical protein